MAFQPHLFQNWFALCSEPDLTNILQDWGTFSPPEVVKLELLSSPPTGIVVQQHLMGQRFPFLTYRKMPSHNSVQLSPPSTFTLLICLFVWSSPSTFCRIGMFALRDTLNVLPSSKIHSSHLLTTIQLGLKNPMPTEIFCKTCSNPHLLYFGNFFF